MDLHTDDAPEGGSERGLFRGLVALFTLAAALAMTDLLADSGDSTSLAHVAMEGAIVATATLGAVLAVRRLRRWRAAAADARASAQQLGVRLAATQTEAERWRREAQDLLRGLGAAIDQQFARWQLSAAETQIAQLLLKGLSHKEVAAVRGVGEATVRQQARAIYTKAGVQGRHELAAFFLEGLLAPGG